MERKLAEGLGVIYGEDLSSNVYLLKDERKGLLVIDAGAYMVLDKEPAMTILTHAHFDHAGGVGESWKDVYLHKEDFRKAPYFEVPPQAKKIDFERIRWGDFELEVIHTPGHTLGSVCLFDRKKGILFSGDTLFADGIGRTDLGGDERLMEKSLALVRKLPYKLLCPGHGELARKE